jgi:hypothetical protein
MKMLSRASPARSALSTPRRARRSLNPNEDEVAREPAKVRALDTAARPPEAQPE